MKGTGKSCSAYGVYFDFANLNYQERAKLKTKYLYTLGKKDIRLHLLVRALTVRITFKLTKLEFNNMYRGIVVYHGGLCKFVLVRPMLFLLPLDCLERDEAVGVQSSSATVRLH